MDYNWINEFMFEFEENNGSCWKKELSNSEIGIHSLREPLLE